MKVKVIENSLFYLLLFFLPTQLGRHFWPTFSTIYGLRIDYLSPTIYVTDILIFLLLTVTIFGKVQTSTLKNIAIFFSANINTKKYCDIFQCKHQTSNKYQYLTRYWEFILLIIFLLVGIFFSKNPWVGFYGLLKIFEFVFLGIYISNKCRKNTSYVERTIVFIFSLGILFESFLAILQFVNQGSLNGLFYFLGERKFTGQTPGIANVSINGQLLLRPYATFPHPNVLAGYLLIGMTLVISNIKYQISNIKKTLSVVSVGFGSIALFLTMSRVAILLWLLVVAFIGVFQLKQKLKIKKFTIYYLLFTILVVGSIFLSSLRYRFSDLSFSSEAVVVRADLIKSSISMFSSSPVFGVGINNFLVNLPTFQKPQKTIFYFQPVHNIFLLVMAETGIVGLAFFLWFIHKTIRHLKKINFSRGARSCFAGQFSILLFEILILGFFDHYFLTLQQGQLLFALVLGLCWSHKSLV